MPPGNTRSIAEAAAGANTDTNMATTTDMMTRVTTIPVLPVIHVQDVVTQENEHIIIIDTEI